MNHFHMRCECLQYINKSNFHFYQNKNQTKINLKYKLSSKEHRPTCTCPQYKCYNTVANTGVLVNRKVKVKPTDENILHVLSLRSTVILKDNIIQVFQFYICGTITIRLLFNARVIWNQISSSMGIKSFSVQSTSNLPLLITHPLLSGDIVLLNLNFEAKLGLPTLYENGLPESISWPVRWPQACVLFFTSRKELCLRGRPGWQAVQGCIWIIQLFSQKLVSIQKLQFCYK